MVVGQDLPQHSASSLVEYQTTIDPCKNRNITRRPIQTCVLQVLDPLVDVRRGMAL